MTTHFSMGARVTCFLFHFVPMKSATCRMNPCVVCLRLTWSHTQPTLSTKLCLFGRLLQCHKSKQQTHMAVQPLQPYVVTTQASISKHPMDTDESLFTYAIFFIFHAFYHHSFVFLIFRRKVFFLRENPSQIYCSKPPTKLISPN